MHAFAVFLARGAVVLGLLALAPVQALAACLFEGAVGGYDQFRCSGNNGVASVAGTLGPDRFIFDAGTQGNITLVSGGGDDIVDFSGFTDGVNLDLGLDGILQFVSGTLNIELHGFNVAGESKTVLGGAGIDLLIGGAGNDILIGNGSTDLLYGVTGNDVLEGGPGDDGLDGGPGDDVLRGGPGADVLQGGPDNDTRANDGADCVGDTIVSIENDLCVIPPPPPPPAPVGVPALSPLLLVLLALGVAGFGALGGRRKD